MRQKLRIILKGNKIYQLSNKEEKLFKILCPALLLLFSFVVNNVCAQSFGEQEGLSVSTNTVDASKKILRTPLLNQSQKNMAETNATPKIMLYYRNFKIDTTPSGRIMCDFDIVIHNSSSYKINTLSMQLIWPSIKTSASFYDVNPREENYLPMTLLGKGCYSMDKVPNIVVNLCRIKGMSGEECSKSIFWVKIR